MPFDQWYTERIEEVNVKGIVDALLKLPLVKEYMRQAWYAGYEQGYKTRAGRQTIICCKACGIGLMIDELDTELCDYCQTHTMKDNM